MDIFNLLMVGSDGFECTYLWEKISVIPGAVGERETGRVAKEHSAPEAAATFFKACACQVPLAKFVKSRLVSP